MKKDITADSIAYLRIVLVSPEKVRDWSRRERPSPSGEGTLVSYGEVFASKTISYDTFVPENDGLFCQRNFGPIRDFACACGEYRIRRTDEGEIFACEKCGVELISSRSRRTRMGCVSLAFPIPHLWYFFGRPSKMATMLGLKRKQLLEIVYLKEYVTRKDKDGRIEMVTGGEALKYHLEEIEVKSAMRDIREAISFLRSKPRTKTKIEILSGRLRVLDQFRQSGGSPSWMVMDVLPVLPPQLRPIMQLGDGAFVASDLNELYKRIIARNNRLVRLSGCGAPPVIFLNDRLLLQESVDRLVDNGRLDSPLLGRNGLPLSSLSDIFKGKEGRFRQNLLGKRVDFSGRSVIVAGPGLSVCQCGLPAEMALALFRPHLLHALVVSGLALDMRLAGDIISMGSDPGLLKILMDFFVSRVVLLNRAPTLHRFGIQGFFVCPVMDYTIALHPSVCAGFNADFDGDTMAVHVPLSLEAQFEAIALIPGGDSTAISQRSGSLVVAPSQDMVIGGFFLGRFEDSMGYDFPPFFHSFDDVVLAYEAGRCLSVGTEVVVRCGIEDVQLPKETIRRKVGERVVRASPDCVIKEDDRLGIKQVYKVSCPGRCMITKFLNFELPLLDGREKLPTLRAKNERKSKQSKRALSKG
jgi:DNA-directed RNA polymerase subunit beta'